MMGTCRFNFLFSLRSCPYDFFNWVGTAIRHGSAQLGIVPFYVVANSFFLLKRMRAVTGV